MNFNIIAVGSLKEKYLKEACAEYLKRLDGYSKAKVTEIPEVRLSPDPGEKEIAAALDKEGAAILDLAGKDVIIALCIEGKELSSEEFAKSLSEFASRGRSSFSFVIGSSHGLSEKVKKAADLRLSMSPMTFPHRLARVMLSEQLYRAMNILGNGKYHK